MKKLILFLSVLCFSNCVSLNAMQNTSYPNIKEQEDQISQFLNKAKQLAVQAGISAFDSAKIATKKFQDLLSKTDVIQLKKTLAPAALTFIFFKLFSSIDILGVGFCIVLWNWILSNSQETATIN